LCIGKSSLLLSLGSCILRGCLSLLLLCGLLCLCLLNDRVSRKARETCVDADARGNLNPAHGYTPMLRPAPLVAGSDPDEILRVLIASSSFFLTLVVCALALSSPSWELVV